MVLRIFKMIATSGFLTSLERRHISTVSANREERASAKQRSNAHCESKSSIVDWRERDHVVFLRSRDTSRDTSPPMAADVVVAVFVVFVVVAAEVSSLCDPR